MTKPRHVIDSFKVFPSHIELDFTTHESSVLRTIDLDDFGIEDTYTLNASINKLINEDELLVWFRGKEMIAMASYGDASFTTLDKNADIFIIKRAPESELGGWPRFLSKVLPAIALDCTPDQFIRCPASASMRAVGMYSPAAYKGLFNKYVANSIDTCLITLTKESEDKEPEIIDRLTWRSKESALGFTLNNTKELWQVSAISTKALTAVKLANAMPGTFVSKAKAADIYKYATVTRYFPQQPTAGVISQLCERANVTSELVIMLHREPGLVAYTLQEVDLLGI